MNDRCPLCQRELIEAEQNGWECPTVTKDISANYKRWKSHYDLTGDEHEYIYVNPYRIMVDPYSGSIPTADPLVYDIGFMIQKFNVKHRNYFYIMSIPKFKIKSEEQVLHKLNTILVFS